MEDANVNVYVNNQQNEHRRNRYMRNETNSSESMGNNASDRQQQHMIFNTYCVTPNQKSEIQESLEAIKRLGSKNSRVYANQERQELFSSNATEKELEQVLTRSVNSEINFEIFNVEQSYAADDNIKIELDKQNKKPSSHYDQIFAYYNVDRYSNPLYNNEQNNQNFEQFNRRDSIGQPIMNYGNNIVSLMNNDGQYNYPTHRANPNNKGTIDF